MPCCIMGDGLWLEAMVAKVGSPSGGINRRVIGSGVLLRGQGRWLMWSRA